MQDTQLDGLGENVRATESAALKWLGEIGLVVPSFVVEDGDEPTVVELVGTGPWVVKPDIALSGKGLKGMVSICHTAAELADAIGHAREMAPAVVEEFVEGEEGYVSIVFDDATSAVFLRASAEGGVGFDPSRLEPWKLNLDQDMRDYQVRDFLRASGVSDWKLVTHLTRAIQAMWLAFRISEATMIEINPYRWSADRWVAVGVALEFEENASWLAQRHRPDLQTQAMPGDRVISAGEAAVEAANKMNLGRPAVKFFQLDGDIAALVIGGGAGLASLDRLTDLGLRPACYVDASPGAPHESLVALMKAGLSIKGLRGAIIGAVVMSLMDTRALTRAVLDAMNELGLNGTQFPIVVRIAGPHEEESHDLLAKRMPAIQCIGREGSIDDMCDQLAKVLEPQRQGSSS